MADQKSPAPMLSQEQFAQLLDVIAQRSAADPNLAEAVMALAKQQSRTVLQQNAQHPGKSAFSHPEGDVERPKAKLTRETFFCANRQEEDLLTPVEIDLFNQITVSKRSRHGTWTADVDADRKTLKILLPHASVDDRMNLPGGLPLILMEFIAGQDAADPSRLAAEVLELRQKFAALEAAQRAAA